MSVGKGGKKWKKKEGGTMAFFKFRAAIQEHWKRATAPPGERRKAEKEREMSFSLKRDVPRKKGYSLFHFSTY